MKLTFYGEKQDELCLIMHDKLYNNINKLYNNFKLSSINLIFDLYDKTESTKNNNQHEILPILRLFDDDNNILKQWNGLIELEDIENEIKSHQ